VVIEPLFEASFRPGSYGFRPKRDARQAIEEIRKWVNFGYDEVIDLDLKGYFDTIDHELLVKLVRRRVRDPRILRLIRLWLRAGVIHEGVWEESVVGTPQARWSVMPMTLSCSAEGGVPSSPCRFSGVSKAHLKLTVNEEKTRVVSAQEGFDFLGVHFRKQPTRRDRRRSTCYAWPSPRSMKRIRDKVRRIIDRDDRSSLAEIVEQLNPVVRGWGNYFSRLNSSRHFWKVDGYVFYKLRRWLRRKHQRLDRAFWSTPPTFFVKAGLHVLHGTVAYGR
jgi:hypothetical protein